MHLKSRYTGAKEEKSHVHNVRVAALFNQKYNMSRIEHKFHKIYHLIDEWNYQIVKWSDNFTISEGSTFFHKHGSWQFYFIDNKHNHFKQTCLYSTYETKTLFFITTNKVYGTRPCSFTVDNNSRNHFLLSKQILFNYTSYKQSKHWLVSQVHDLGLHIHTGSI